MNYEIPTYKVVVKSPDGKTFDTAGIITGLTLTESKSQLAQRATIRMFNRYISKH